MKFPQHIRVVGDVSYRGPCPTERAEQIAFFAWLRTARADLAAVAIHPRNEGIRTATRAHNEKLEGLTRGAPDVIIVGSPPLLIELKRRDHTKSRWQDGQVEFLTAAQGLGASVCVALGADAAAEIVTEWATTIYS